MRDLERRFGVAIGVEADDTLTGANYHAIERGEPATGIKSEGGLAKSLVDDIAPIEGPRPVEAEDEETLEVSGEENEEVGRLSDRGSSPSLEDGEIGRRRRRRRRRRGERSFGDSVPPDAPQPTDDGLAVVAEIGGDLVAQSDEVDAFARRGPRSGEERHRRSRGSRGERSRLRRTDGERMPEAGLPGFDLPPSLALEQEFTASEADYSPAPPPSDTVSHRETAVVEPALVAGAHEVDVEGRTPDATRAEPTAEAASAPARADAAAEGALPSDPPATDAPRPRRSGWWQRARSTVIGK